MRDMRGINFNYSFKTVHISDNYLYYVSIGAMMANGYIPVATMYTGLTATSTTLSKLESTASKTVLVFRHIKSVFLATDPVIAGIWPEAQTKPPALIARDLTCRQCFYREFSLLLPT
jgi:hypothetical protein